ncbi:hypothetical protein LQ327_18895 [Actinomycetospora endophytica]|uniref:DUF4386 family protein n=1 Tax=Actinomycetospora endophytica TaxID=2291215 RepID=A0ABS8PC10_9PSEU|nr:hypothetical protein [Actinomycetospora endophytica]MCD2195442.1 hypothetical protein [Actinomycetospora endophytica]
MTVTSPTTPGARHQLAPETSAESGTESSPPGRVYPLAARGAAIVLPLGAVLAAVSTVFDPHSTEPEPRGMYVAYGADPAGADVAATVLHYGFLSLAVGLLLAGLALTSRRGRALAVVGGFLGFLGFANLSGAVTEDWFDAQMAAALGPDTAMALSQKALAMPALTAGWMVPMMLGFSLGPVLLVAGLARARVVRWWVLVLPVACTVMFTVGDGLGPVGFLATLAAWAVFGLILGRAFWTAPARD